MPSAKDFVKETDRKLTTTILQKWSLGTAPRAEGERRRRPGRGVDATATPEFEVTEVVVVEPTRGAKTTRGQLADSDALTRGQCVVDLRTTSSDWRTLKGLPRSAKQISLLRYLITEQAKTELNRTAILSRCQISEATGFQKNSIDKTLRRFVERGWIRRNEVSHACNAGGCSYSVPKVVVNRLISSDAGPKADENSDSRTLINSDSRTLRDVSSMFLNTPTTKPPSVSQLSSAALQAIIVRFQLDIDYRISVNDLVTAQRQSGMANDEIETSIDHLVFYLGTEDAKSIKHPKAFILSRLQAGFYGPPVDFVSREERLLSAKVAALKEKAKRLALLKREGFEASFDIWFAELTQERKSELTRGTPYSGMNGPALKACLRETFGKETSQELPEDTGS
jgi:hypothetical protein